MKWKWAKLLFSILLTIYHARGSKLIYSSSIINRFQEHCKGLSSFISVQLLAERVEGGLFPEATERDIFELASETAAFMTTDHPDYGLLAGRLAVSQLHRQTADTFSETINKLYNELEDNGKGFISKELYEFTKENAIVIDSHIQLNRDFDFDYFGYKTLEKSYLLRISGEIVERPQYMWMRVALGIHLIDRNLTAALETYDMLSRKQFIHASPTLFHAGSKQPQMSSCFLLGIEDDSIAGIYKALQQCALISKTAGGIGLSVSKVRGKDSYIRGTRGTSNGLVPMLRVFDATARYVDQGGGRRPGAIAVYVEPWHVDIFDLLELRKNTGKEEHRTRDLFYGLWIPDLFMKKVESDGQWALFCPSKCPELIDSWGAEFEKNYDTCLRQGKAAKLVSARLLWQAILDSQMETGTPYMLFKDACNAKSNQQNLGTIKSSNLCTEIIQYTSPTEAAVCNLASVILPSFVCCGSNSYAAGTVVNNASCTTSDEKHLSEVGHGCFDHNRLREAVKIMTRNLNKIIDGNYYPIPEAKYSNLQHRPIGIGVQGLADVFQLLRLPFDSAEAKQLNIDIFETIYYAALEASCELAEKDGWYSSYSGSPVSKGILQFDMWNTTPTSSRWDWSQLKARIAKFGVRNSLLVAPMPTATTAQIAGNNECFEPYTSNLYARRVRAGEFIVINPHLLKDLINRGLWTKEVRNELIWHGGSLAEMNTIPTDLKALYKTVWEIKQRTLIDMAADRAPYIDQSQSLNAFIAQPDYSKLTAMHFHAWKKGLKTGMYYLRTQPAANAIQFTVDKSMQPAASRHPSIPDKSVDDSEDNVCSSCSG